MHGKLIGWVVGVMLAAAACGGTAGYSQGGHTTHAVSTGNPTSATQVASGIPQNGGGDGDGDNSGGPSDGDGNQ